MDNFMDYETLSIKVPNQEIKKIEIELNFGDFTMTLKFSLN